jgi:eukaryotic-like serine/threonine-protein kinase
VASLRYRDGHGSEHEYSLDERRPVRIGRGEDVDIRLTWDPSVSAVHAELLPVGAHWLLGDDGMSRNGTFLNGARLKGRRRLHHEDVVRVGRTVLDFSDPARARSAATTVTDAGAISGTVTMLFTDIAGSTELIARLGDERGDRVLREHFAVLREAARAHDGHEVKSLGDGLMIAFPSALGAVRCAVAMQRQIAARGGRVSGDEIGLRVGLNAGETISVGDDYFGMSVVVAKRLCDRAAPGQVLVSDVVRSLVGGREDVRFAEVGELELKGVADRVGAFELDWRHSPSAARVHAPAGSQPHEST